MCHACQVKYGQEMDFDFEAWLLEYIEQAGIKPDETVQVIKNRELLYLPMWLIVKSLDEQEADVKAIERRHLEHVRSQGKNPRQYFEKIARHVIHRYFCVDVKDKKIRR